MTQFSRSLQVLLEKCPACGGSHTFDFEAIMEERIAAFFSADNTTETHEIVTQCPTKLQRIIIPINITVVGGEVVAEIREMGTNELE